MSTERELLAQAFDRHRLRTFGESSLTVYGMTPTDGEASSGSFSGGWKGGRVSDVTSQVQERDSSEWQFQVMATADWSDEESESNQLFMLSAVALTVGAQRWKITKVQKPVGAIGVWKLRAEQQ